jgi:peptidoglycan/xylan/chitin deacetylase (PgdA/CDA1 family)
MVLAFHKVEPGFTWGVTNYSPRRFERLLDTIKEFNQSEAPDNCSLTFDDGYQSFLNFADPLLVERDMSATIFAITGYLGKRNSWDYSSVVAPAPHMTEAELRAAASHGHRVQSHTHTHRDLRTLSRAELRAELSESKQRLEDILGNEVTEICYPFGLYNAQVEEIALEVGYQRGWSMRPDDNGPFTFGRWGVYGFDSPLTVWSKMNPDSFGATLERIKLRAINSLARAGRFAFWTE